MRGCVCVGVLLFSAFGCEEKPAADGAPREASRSTSPPPSPSVGTLRADPRWAATKPAVLPPDPEPGQVVLGRDGEKLAEPAAGRFASGVQPCPPRLGAPCDVRERQACAVHDLVSCAAGCEAYRSHAFECSAGKWREVGTTEAPCVCRLPALRGALAKCKQRYVRVEPSEASPIDGCAAAFTCGASDLWVECDGENDETGTSLCTCFRDRERVRAVESKLVRREGLEACFDAAAVCAGAR